MQQMQNGIGAVTDSQALINRFCGALDAIPNTLSTQIDASKKSTLDSMTRTAEFGPRSRQIHQYVAYQNQKDELIDYRISEPLGMEIDERNGSNGGGWMYNR
jgi:hypothetical protein